MSRNLNRTALGAAGLVAAASTALGSVGHVEPIQPQNGNFEFVGDGSSGSASVIVGFDTVNNGPLDVSAGTGSNLISIEYFDSTNNSLLTVVVPRANYFLVDDSAGSNNADDNIDDNEVWGLDLSGLLPLAPANAYCFDVILQDGGDTDSLNSSIDGVPDDNSGDHNDSSDERFTIIRTPSLVSALVDASTPAMAQLFLTYSFSDAGNGGTTNPTSLPLTLRTPDFDPSSESGVLPANLVANPNQTDEPLNATTVQIADDAGFTTGVTTLTSYVSNVAVANGDIFTTITFDSTAQPLVGKFLRINPAGTAQIREESGLQPQGTVQVQTLQPLAVVSVSFKSQILDNIGPNPHPGAVAVEFNRALSNAGTTAYYNDTLGGGTGMGFVNGGDTFPSGLDFQSPTLDSNNNAIVLLDVTDPTSGTNGPNDIVADGLPRFTDGDASDGQPFIELNTAGGNGPTPLFGTGGGPDAPEGRFNIGDMIVPTIQSVGTFDLDGDGVLDHALAIIDEPISTISSSAGFELTSLDGVATFPIFMQDPMMHTQGLQPPGGIPTENSATATENVIPIVSVSNLSVDLDRDGTISARETDSVIAVEFDPFDYDWDHDGDTRNDATPDADEPLPDTGAFPFNLFFNATGAGFVNPLSTNNVPSGAEFMDANGNMFDGSSVFAANASNDYAPPALVGLCYLDGEALNSNNNNTAQLFETSGVGPNVDDRLVILGGENFSGLSDGTIDDQLVQVGSGGMSFDGGEFLHFSPANAATMRDDGGELSGAGALAPGSTATVIFDTNGPGNGFRDSSNNQLTFTGQMIDDCTAPYIPQVRDVNQNAQAGAFLVPDASGDFAAEIRARASQPIDDTTVFADAFGVNFGGTVDTATVDGTDPTLLIFGLGGAQIGIDNTVSFTYDPSSTQLVASQDPPAGTGVAVDQIQQTVNIVRLQNPFRDSRSVAIMDVTGTLLGEDGNPVPLGTKIYAFSAVPVVRSVTAQHNNIEFTYTIDDPIYGPYGLGLEFNCENFLFNTTFPNFHSCGAFTNWVHGIFPRVYLHRDECNHQFFTNSKVNQFLANDPGDNDEEEYSGRGGALVGDTIEVRFQGAARSLGQIRFQGSAERRENSLRNGVLNFAWDVIRTNTFWVGSNGAGLNDYYQAGYSYGGTPVVMGATVIDNSTGAFSMHVSQPRGEFNGKTLLDSVDRPVIFIAEFPDGTRCALSSLLVSATSNDHDGDGDIGDAILFNANNLMQDAGEIEPFVLNFDLRRVGKQVVYPEWNIVPLNRSLGVATGNRGIPALPSGVTSDDIITYNTNNLPFAGPLDSAVYWAEGGSSSDRDGVWTAADDDTAGFFSSMFLDVDLSSYFAFTMTTSGIQMGSGITNLTPGYAVGFFNNSTVPFAPTDFGVHLFGEALDQPSVFPSNPITSGNRNAADGWILGAITTDHADPTSFFSANSGANYIIVFRNMGRGPNLGSTSGTGDVLIDVRSANSAGPNDLEEVGPEGAFIHYDN